MDGAAAAAAQPAWERGIDIGSSPSAVASAVLSSPQQHHAVAADHSVFLDAALSFSSSTVTIAGNLVPLIPDSITVLAVVFAALVIYGSIDDETAARGTGEGASNSSSSTASSNKVVNDEVKVKVDLSIPYDAAARLAYETEGYDDTTIDFATFRDLYTQKAVAEVIAKRREQEATLAVERARQETLSAASELELLRKAKKEAKEATAKLIYLQKKRT